MKTETHFLEKPELVGFYSLPLYHFKITPQVMPSGRVSFAVEGDSDELKKAMQDLADNRPVGARDLLESIKRVRTLMFTTKQAGAH